MTVYVLIEFTGGPSECDGAIVQGVFATREAAEAALAGFPKTAQKMCEIEAHEVVETQ